VPERDGRELKGHVLLLGDAIVNHGEPSVADVLGILAAIPEAFEHAYHQIVQAVILPGLPLLPRSMIYAPTTRYGHHSRSSIIMFNHAIIRLACIAGIP